MRSPTSKILAALLTIGAHAEANAAELTADAFYRLYEYEIGHATSITLEVERLPCVGGCALGLASDFDPRFLFGVGSALTPGGGAAYGVGIGDPEFISETYAEVGTMEFLSGGNELFSERSRSDSRPLSSFPAIGETFDVIFDIVGQQITVLGQTYSFAGQLEPTRILIVQGDDSGERIQLNSVSAVPIPPALGLLALGMLPILRTKKTV